MCVFNFFLNNGKDNCLKSLSKLLQMLTALWRKRRCPDFCLTWRNIKGFSVSSVMIVNRLASSERLTQVCGGQALHAPKRHYSVSVVEMLIYW